MTRCDGVHGIFGPCPADADYTVTSGCVHEHVKTGPICGDDLRAWLDGDGALCLECWESDDRHACERALISHAELPT
jgi:hypothetical protein